MGNFMLPRFYRHFLNSLKESMKDHWILLSSFTQCYPSYLCSLENSCLHILQLRTLGFIKLNWPATIHPTYTWYRQYYTVLPGINGAFYLTGYKPHKGLQLRSPFSAPDLTHHPQDTPKFRKPHWPITYYLLPQMTSWPPFLS